MALRSVAAAIFAGSQTVWGFRALYSTSSEFSFKLPQAVTEKPPPAEPSTNFFVSGLSKRTTTEGLRAAFANHGEVVHAKVVTDRVSGYSKGVCEMRKMGFLRKFKMIVFIGACLAQLILGIDSFGEFVFYRSAFQVQIINMFCMYKDRISKA